ncbi:MAG: dihydrofolate reductase [Phycisphaerales bacterium]
MLAAIVAMGRNRVIGRDGDLPWRLPDEMAHFKRTTLGRVVIMGRRTFDELGRALPKRVNIVVTRSRTWAHEGVHVAHDFESAVGLARQLAGPNAWDDPDGCPVVIGGGEVYQQAMPRVDRLYLTEVDAAPEGDTTFPDLDADEWVEVEVREHAADEKHAVGFRIRVLERRSGAPRDV